MCSLMEIILEFYKPRPGGDATEVPGMTIGLACGAIMRVCKKVKSAKAKG